MRQRGKHIIQLTTIFTHVGEYPPTLGFCKANFIGFLPNNARRLVASACRAEVERSAEFIPRNPKRKQLAE
jgi:hypothetical protein